MTVRASNRSQTLPLFVRGLAGAVSGSAEAEKSLIALKAVPGSGGPSAAMLGIRELEIAALMAAMQQDYDKAITSMKEATSLEEAMGPPSGPPGLIKPSHELYGEIWLRAGRPREAAEEFGIALLRQPNRARSLLGLARAAAKSGDPAGSASAYTKLLDQWQQADESLPELREARDYLKRAKP
jgi:tetratricopeptide (TPR) repeat protein